MILVSDRNVILHYRLNGPLENWWPLIKKSNYPLAHSRSLANQYTFRYRENLFDKLFCRIVTISKLAPNFYNWFADNCLQIILLLTRNLLSKISAYGSMGIQLCSQFCTDTYVPEMPSQTWPKPWLITIANSQFNVEPTKAQPKLLLAIVNQ